MSHKKEDVMKHFIKRVFDIAFSIIGILFMVPVWIVIGIAIKLTSKGPIFYIHKRVGLKGREFNCYKFRSMYVGSKENILVSDPGDERVTKIGHFIRKTSLDETPQLINVLVGDMSVVGPRPALLSQVKEFTASETDKLLVKPGLTGWTQVNGRNMLPYKKRLELDSWYAKHWTLLLDFKIIFKTLFVIFKQEGIYDVK